MLTIHSHDRVRRHVIGRQVRTLLSLTVPGARLLSMPTPIHAQADSSESRPRSASQPPIPPAAGASAGRVLFGQQYATCHGTDGTGSPAHGLLPEIPDFTKGSWQRKDRPWPSLRRPNRKSLSYQIVVDANHRSSRNGAALGGNA